MQADMSFLSLPDICILPVKFYILHNAPALYVCLCV